VTEPLQPLNDATVARPDTATLAGEFRFAPGSMVGGRYRIR